MSPDRCGKIKGNLLVLPEPSRAERGEAISGGKLYVAPTRKVMGKMLGNKMKNYMVLFIHLSTSLLPSGLCYFHPV